VKESSREASGLLESWPEPALKRERQTSLVCPLGKSSDCVGGIGTMEFLELPIRDEGKPAIE